MSSDKWTSIGAVSQVFDGPHATPKKTESGPIFLGIASLNQGSLDIDQSARISEVDFVKWTRRVTPEPGDIVFSYETRLGEAAIIPHGLRCCLGRRMGLLRPDRSKVIPEFLLYAYLAPDFQELIKSRTIHGSTVDRIALKDLPNFPIQIPSIQEQRRVVEILNGINGKLSTNRQINQTLEQIAQAIFKSWFVDFDPVKAKIWANENGHDPERAAMCALAGLPYADDALDHLSPEQQQQLATTAALFPDSLEESELGKIPSGWKPRKLEEIIELSYGKALKKTERTDGEFPVYGSGGVTGTHNEYLVRGPGIIVGRKGTVGSLYWEDADFFPIDTVFYVKCKETCNLAFAFYLLQTLGLEHMNTDAAVPGLNRNNVYRLEIPNFPSKLIEAFGNMINPMRTLISAKRKEIAQLDNLRDTLLPKLLSGELSVADLPEVADAEASA